jgi:hypothetical protein
VVPERRKITPAVLRMHSVKNRFLMRVKNITPGLYWHCLRPATLRDALVVGGCLMSEPSSLPAFWKVVRKMGRAIRKRSQVMGKKAVDNAYMTAWFQEQPASRPVNAREFVPESPSLRPKAERTTALNLAQ